MTRDAQKQTSLDAVSLVRAAEQLLIQVSRASSDPTLIAKINVEYSQLDSFLSQLLHTLAVVDDELFSSTISALKQQATILQEGRK
jgi:hypothetical protein